MKFRFYIMYCIFLVLFVSCKQTGNKLELINGGNAIDKLTPEIAKKFTGWIENKENNLLQEKTISDITFSALYKPHDYMAMLEIGNTDSMNTTKFETIKQSYEGMDYFTFKIATDKTKDELLKYKTSTSNEYYSRLEYYSFKAQDDFMLLSGKDSLQCKLFHFERTFGLAPVLTFVLGFQGARKKGEDLTLAYNDRIFSSGMIKLNYSVEVLNSIPTIKIK